MDRKELHDLLLAQMPEGASHEQCSLCLASTTQPEGGTQVGKTYTEDELQTAVAEATAELAAELKAIKDAAQESEVAAAVAAVRAESAAEIEELRTSLDNAVLAAQAAKAELDTFKADLEALVAAAEAEAEIASRRDARVEEAKKYFPEEHVEANAERYAAMSDEDWESRTADWAAMAPNSGGVSDAIPSKTALTAAREDNNSNSGMAAIRDAMRGVLVGRDPRTL